MRVANSAPCSYCGGPGILYGELAGRKHPPRLDASRWGWGGGLVCHDCYNRLKYFYQAYLAPKTPLSDDWKRQEKYWNRPFPPLPPGLPQTRQAREVWDDSRIVSAEQRGKTLLVLCPPSDPANCPDQDQQCVLIATADHRRALHDRTHPENCRNWWLPHYPMTFPYYAYLELLWNAVVELEDDWDRCPALESARLRPLILAAAEALESQRKEARR